MRQKLFGAVVSVAAVVLLAFLWVQSRETAAVPEEYREQTLTYENGDYVYRYEPEEIAADAETSTIYVENLLLAYTEPGLSRSQKERLAEQAGGVLVGEVTGGINLMQIRVEEASFSGLSSLAAKLMEEDGILYASHDIPLWLGETSVDTNPWGSDAAGTVEGDEENPSGNNWWAEAIGAYTAWEYEDLFQEVTVGVLDAGFDLEHEDMEGRLTLLDGYTQHTADSHGTQVTALICARNNEIGLRGVASGASGSDSLHVLCADWSPYTNEEDDPDYENYLTNGEFAEILSQMVQQGARAVNCSWGEDLRSMQGHLDNYFDRYWAEGNRGDLDDYLVWWQNYLDDTSRQCIWMMLELLMYHEDSGGTDFLMVQAAGNGEDNKGLNPADSWNGGFFTRITDSLFWSCVPEGSVNGFTYQDIEERILIVGAAENTRDEDGNYQMATFSNFGSTVDICAPGEQIYTAIPGGYVEDSRGTSLAAPLVTGSAALLWSLDPALSAPEVRSLLLENAAAQAYAGEGQTGTYPMLHIGRAAQALLEQKGLERVCAVSVTDGETGEPVEDAVVTLLDVEALGTDFGTSGEDDFLARFRLAEQETDAAGQTSFEECAEDAYPVYIRAQGYEDWTGWLDVSSYFPSEGEPQVNAVSLTPGPQADELLQGKLEELAAQYGVMPVGTELFAGTGYGAGEHLVPQERLTGLLCADVYDYDGDGQAELLTIRARPAEAYSPGDSASPGWVDTRLYISVYEAAGGLVELADEREISVLGLPDTLFSSSIQFARGTSGGSASLYLDYYFNFNSQGFSTIRLQYKGQLTIAGGVDCSEFAYQSYCDTGASEGALETMGGRQLGLGGNRSGWVEGERYDWETVSPEIPAGDLESYRQDWQQGLAEIGLESSFFRTLYLAPEVEVMPDLSVDMTEYDQYLKDCCTSRPAERWTMPDGGSLAELGGILSPAEHEADGVEFTVYDSTGLLEGYRK